MSEETPDDRLMDDEMARRVRLVGLAVVVGALLLIALSTMTLKTDQVNKIPLERVDIEKL